MNIDIKEIGEDGEYEVVGRIRDGEPDEDALQIASAEAWDEWSEEYVLASFDGPTMVAETAE